MPVSQDDGWVRWVLEHWQQVLAHPLVASLVGALGASAYAFPGASRGAKALNGVASFFIGIYVGPSLIEWRHIESERIGAAIIVGCALGGLIGVNAGLEYLRTTKLAQWPFFRTLLAPAVPAAPGGGA